MSVVYYEVERPISQQVSVKLHVLYGVWQVDGMGPTLAMRVGHV